MKCRYLTSESFASGLTLYYCKLSPGCVIGSSDHLDGMSIHRVCKGRLFEPRLTLVERRRSNGKGKDYDRKD